MAILVPFRPKIIPTLFSIIHFHQETLDAFDNPMAVL